MNPKQWLQIAVFACVLSGVSWPAWAGENEMMDALLHKLVEKRVLTQEEAQEIRREVAEESARADALRTGEEWKGATEKTTEGKWIDTVRWKGDLLLRHETQKREPAADRNRERLRLRFGFTAKPVEPIEIGVRLATGASGDPVSTNQSFDSTFDKKSVFVDRAYAKYTPTEWLSLTGGKMENPFETTDIIWDSDVTPEGAAVQWASPTAAARLNSILPIKPFLNIGAFQIEELSGDFGDPAMFVFQAGSDVDLPGGFQWRPSVAYYETTGMEGKQTSDITNAPSGNSTVGGFFQYDYDMVNFVSVLKPPKVFGQPVALITDVTRNPGASDDNGAWQAGTEIGKVTERFGSWKASYFYKRLEPDATFGAITDGDFGTGGTNHKGHIVGVQAGLNKYASVGLKYFRTDEVEGAQAHNDTFQADLQLKY